MSRLTADEIRADVESLFSPAHPPTRPGAVGAEVELIPVLRRRDGPPGPLPLHPAKEGQISLLGFLQEYGRDSEKVAADPDRYGAVRFRTFRDGCISFEPGGQLEYATLPRDTAAAAAADVSEVLGALREAAAEAGIHLLAVGLNPWHSVEEVALQLTTGRYRAMDRYFARRGPHGQQMMRLTASMQVNLDFGDPEQARRRWRAANLLTPVCTAAFANSAATLADGAPAVSGRAAIWHRVDPTRTGTVLTGTPVRGAEPWGQYLVFALKARVMMRQDDDGNLRDASEDFRFNEWWAGVRGPPPSAEEWRIHLTTLFPSVRPRGWLELRALDVPAQEWWSVPLTVLPALLYDDRALVATLEALEPHAAAVADLAGRASLTGLRDPVIGDLAERLFDIGQEATGRFPAGYFSDGMLAATAEFCARYVRRRRTQADDDRDRRQVEGGA